MNLPSEISFVSLLQYSPRGSDELAKRSRGIRDAIKRDSYISVRRSGDVPEYVQAIKHFANVIKTHIEQRRDRFPFLAQAFGADVVLIPMPSSAPLVNSSALWSPMSICKALKARGLAGEILPILKRTQAVQKSAHASPGRRPNPEDHYRSTAVTGLSELPMFTARKITLVDDFVTRGSTFLGVYPHIKKAFPGWSIECFALVRTQSYGTLDQILAPVEGKITFRNGQLWRNP
jgi:hypothetical protein